MVNERAKSDMEDLLEEVQAQMQDIGRLQNERARLTATGTSRKKLVTVTVNADGTVIETKFGTGFEELTAAELAKAVTAAAQQAAAEVSRKGQELMAPLRDRRARLPKLNELIEDMPDFSSVIPVAPEVSTAPPGAKERRDDAEDSSDPQFSNVEVVEHGRAGDRGVTDSSW